MPRSLRPVVMLLLGLVVALTGALVPATTAATAASTGSISGQMLVTGGAPIAGAEVTLYAGDGWEWYASDIARTDATGSYTFPTVEPGTYRLGFRDPSGDHVTEYWSNYTTLDDADDVHVAPGAALTGRSVVVTRAGHVSGVVTGDAGAPLAGVSVIAYMRTGPVAAGIWQRMDETLTTDDGSYDLGGLAQGSYRLSFVDDGETYLPEF